MKDEIDTVVTCSTHGLESGDIIEIHIEHGFWKLFMCWVLRKVLKRTRPYKISSVTESTFTYKVERRHE